MKDECPRTLAIYRPGVPMGFGHHFAYSGRVPCTGSLVCTMCGLRKDPRGYDSRSPEFTFTRR